MLTGEGNFRSPTESTPLDRSPKNLVQMITSAAPTAVLCKSVHGDLLGETVKYNEFYLFIYTFFGNSSTVQAHRRIFTLDGSNDADSRKGVPFGGFIDIAPHFGGKIPQKPQFWGVNRRFQAKRAKY